ncbi:MAG: carbohydrate kinase family protein [Thaumarchaeota archaeon]|nr:carbohydrate kinase family protein [Nitrososphaerota archaeon]MDE1839448.1 carbohydrate kinase family protein [Nitrososphaerota archaeon]
MLEKLQNLKLVNSVVVLNDFFLDRIIKIQNLDNLYQQILEKSKLGGSIRGIPQTDLKGGNATNVAYALARLGCPVSLITIADKISSQILKETFSEFDKVSLAIIDGKPGRTTSLEFNNTESIVNVMISDLGDNENFGPEKLGIAEQNMLASADAVIMTNWASNKKGTELSQFAFSQSASAFHLLDPADIQSRSEEFKQALPKLVDCLNSLCVNENECNILLKQSELDMISGEKETKKLVQELAKRYSIPIDLHTSAGSYWSNGKEVEYAKSFQVQPKFITGAGDVWDAANMLGYLASLGDLERLRFANGAASLYVGNPLGIPPTMDEVLSFVRTNCL